MAQHLQDLSREAGADLSAKQFYAGALNSSGELVLGAAGTALGIIQDKPKDNTTGRLRLQGISPAIVNGNSVNIAVGDPLKSDSNGLLVKAATDKDRVVAIALQAATADGIYIDVLLTGVSWLGA